MEGSLEGPRQIVFILLLFLTEETTLFTQLKTTTFDKDFTNHKPQFCCSQSDQHILLN